MAPRPRLRRQLDRFCPFSIPGVTFDPTGGDQLLRHGHGTWASGIDTTEAIDIAGQRAEVGDAVHAVP